MQLSPEEFEQLKREYLASHSPIHGPDYWQRQYEEERAKYKEMEQLYIKALDQVEPLQDRIRQLEASLAQLVVEYQDSEKAWQVNWDRHGEFHLIESLLKGESVVIPKEGVLAEVNKIREERNELLRLCQIIYHPNSLHSEEAVTKAERDLIGVVLGGGYLDIPETFQEQLIKQIETQQVALTTLRKTLQTVFEVVRDGLNEVIEESRNV